MIVLEHDSYQRRRSLPNIHEVARRAGVSLGTVSNVLNHPELVAETTRVRVQQIITEMGFIRNGSARTLRAGRSQSLGLIVLDIANPFFTEVARGVEDAANEAGYVLILGNSGDSLAKEINYLRVLEEKRIDGLLITPVQSDLASLKQLRDRGVAIVLLDRSSQSNELCSVTVDDVLGGQLAANHLLEQGHTHLGFVHGPLSIQQVADRQRGLLDAVKAAGLDPAVAVADISTSAQNVHEGEAAVQQLLQVQPLPTAVFCANDLLALGLMRGLAQQGISIPRDVALVGYDDVEFASVLVTPLTSIRQPKYLLGYTAAQLLLEEITAPNTHHHQQVLYQPEMIVRDSSIIRR